VRCGKSFSESQPLDGLRVDFDKACQVAHLFVEGCGVRAIERLTHLNRRTVLGILQNGGERCARLLEAKIRNVKAEHIQADELVSFVRTKQENTEKDDDEHGSFFTFLSIDRDSKLIINWRVGKHTRPEAEAFLRELKARVSGRFQLSTDNWGAYSGYTGAVRHVFGEEAIDYAVESKIYAAQNNATLNRYSSPRLVCVRKRIRLGEPNLKLTTTSHCERTNLSVRLFNRRFTRRTLGYSKKLDNLRHAVALFVAHFNFCRVHSAHKQTPAQAAGLTKHAWTLEELLAATN